MTGWRLRGLTRDVLVVKASAARASASPRRRAIPPRELRADIAAWLVDPTRWSLVQEMLASFGGSATSARTRRTRDALGRALAERFEHGLLQAFAMTRDAAGAFDQPSEDKPPPPLPKPPDDDAKQTWISIRLVDSVGVPVPKRRYRLTLPDGTIREGVTNAQGSAYFGDIDPGMCTLEWPHTDGADWKNA
jgi:hypothetical protein